MSVEAEQILASWVADAVEAAKKHPSETWRPGEKLKILLIGYNGKRNTGADVRVAAMVDQFYHVLGKENVEIGITTFGDPETFKSYFDPATKTVQLDITPSLFEDLMKVAAQYHMGVISEGSTLKSKWSNSLTLFFAAAMGIMKSLGKPCMAYGSGAGEMDDWLRESVKGYCDKTYFICREEQSTEIVKGLGMEVEMGVDTAWTFSPGSLEWAERELREKAGWGGKKPLLGVAVINPFWWPVRPDLVKWQSGYAQEHPDEWYDSFMFFTFGEERKKLFNRYLTNIAWAVEEFSKKHDMQVVILGMEALDHDAIARLQKMLRVPSQLFSSRDYDAYQMTALLWKLSMLVTSRYHARVLSMPAGVPSLAISMDERLYNLLNETGHLKDYYLPVDDEALGEKLLAAMEKMWGEREKVREELLRKIPYYFESMANMGVLFRKFVKKNFPQFRLPPEPESWKGYLPPLDPSLSRILEECGD